MERLTLMFWTLQNYISYHNSNLVHMTIFAISLRSLRQKNRKVRRKAHKEIFFRSLKTQQS
jgi:hypothetical protein